MTTATAPRLTVTIPYLPRPQQRVIHEQMKTRRRAKNNEASKVCRASRKSRYRTMEEEASDLEERNQELRERNSALEKRNSELKELMSKALRWLKEGKMGAE